jgi:hypothetical protein
MSAEAKPALKSKTIWGVLILVMAPLSPRSAMPCKLQARPLRQLVTLSRALSQVP